MNNVNLIGRIGKDIELKYTNSQMAYCKFSIAVPRKFVKQGEERQTDWINIVVWGKTAEFCAKWFDKGSQIALTGRIQTGNYEKDGVRMYTFDVVAENVYFADTVKKKNDAVKENNNDGFVPIDEDEEELPF